MTECQIENWENYNILGNLDKIFHPIWSRGCGEMALDSLTERKKDGQQTEEAATIYSSFGKHKKKSEFL